MNEEEIKIMAKGITIIIFMFVAFVAGALIF